MTHSIGQQATGYLYDNAWAHARRRLDLLARGYDSATQRRLAATGVGSGWRCLEVGGGSGSVAAWLCRCVGDSGRVMATDIDTAFLEHLDETNLDVVRHDVTADPLPAAEFDLVHVRAVLTHVTGRDGALAALCAAVRPGGWVVIEEYDRYGLDGLAVGHYAEAQRWMCAAMVAAGADLTWARGLPARLQTAGFGVLQVDSSNKFFPGGSEGAELVDLSLVQVWPRAVDLGAPPELLTAAQAELRDPTRWFTVLSEVAVTAQRVQ